MAGDQLDRDDGDCSGGSDSRRLLSSLTFGWLAPDELQADPDLDEIIAQQFAELGTLPPEPDWERMRAACEAGHFRVWAAKDDRRIIAWVEYNLGQHYHYGATKFAWDCGHYCHRDYRPWTWFRLMRSSATALKEIGVTVVTWHANHRMPLEGAFRRLGAEPHGQMFQRTL